MPRASPPPANPRSAARSRSLPRSALELVLTIAFALGIALTAQAYVVKPYKIPTGSMEPTLRVGQRVLVNRLSVEFGGPHVGQIIVFHPPVGADRQECGEPPQPVLPGHAACVAPSRRAASEYFIKRIVAGPGDQIYISGGHVYRRAPGAATFSKESDSYIAPCEQSPECDFRLPVTVPGGHWYMMGDNRGNSDDSRFWGPIPTSWIIGEAVATYWPLDRLGLL